MTSRPGPRQMGAFLRHQAEELTRIWRLARQGERSGVSPGLLDALVEPFLVEAGTLLEQGAAPESAIQRTSGVLRWAPGLAPAELSAEWTIVGDVLATSCEQSSATAEAAEWLQRAVAAANAASAATDGGRGPTPPRLVVVLTWPTPKPRAR